MTFAFYLILSFSKSLRANKDVVNRLFYTSKTNSKVKKVGSYFLSILKKTYFGKNEESFEQTRILLMKIIPSNIKYSIRVAFKHLL